MIFPLKVDWCNKNMQLKAKIARQGSVARHAKKKLIFRSLDIYFYFLQPQ